LNAEVGGGTGNYSYTWTSDPAGFSSTEPSPLVYPLESVTYMVEVTDGNDAVEDEVSVIVYPVPVIELGSWPEYLCNQQQPPVQLTALPEGGIFSGSNVSPDGLFTPEEAPLGWNVITYTYTDENDCEATAQDSIFVDDCVGITGYKEEITLSVYPNPARNVLHVQIEGVNEADAGLSLVNAMGKVVYKRNIAGRIATHKQAIDLSGLPKGLYMLRLVVGNESHELKVLVAR